MVYLLLVNSKPDNVVLYAQKIGGKYYYSNTIVIAFVVKSTTLDIIIDVVSQFTDYSGNSDYD